MISYDHQVVIFEDLRGAEDHSVLKLVNKHRICFDTKGQTEFVD